MAQYKIQSGETLSGIASKLGTSVQALASANNIIDPNRVFSGQVLNVADTTAKPINLTPTPEQNMKALGFTPSIVQPSSTSDIKNGTINPPVVPKVESPAVVDTFNTSMTSDLEAKKKSVADAYQKQLDDADRRAKEAQTSLDQLTTQYKNTLEEAKPLMEPYRQQLETTERDRLKIEQNFSENQKLTDELGTLLTDIQTSVKKEQEITGLGAIRNPRITDAKNEATARVGVIEAVMAARNNQITVAENMIDRTANAINADRQDKLNYYNTLLNFYSTQRTEAGEKLSIATSDQKNWVKAQIGTLEKQLADSETNVNYIKSLMMDPDTAQAVGQAGVKLTDSPEQVGVKLANYGYQKELTDSSNKMAEAGYKPVLLGQTVPAGAQTITTTDSKGNSKTWYTIPAGTSVNLQTFQGPGGEQYSFNPKTGETKQLTGTPTEITIGPNGEVITPAMQKAQNIIDQVKKLEESPHLNEAVGFSLQKLVPWGVSLGVEPGRASFIAELDRLKALLSVDNMKLFKGQGAISDAERKLIADMGTSLNTDATQSDFKKELARIKSAALKVTGVDLTEKSSSDTNFLDNKLTY